MPQQLVTHLVDDRTGEVIPQGKATKVRLMIQVINPDDPASALPPVKYEDLYYGPESLESLLAAIEDHTRFAPKIPVTKAPPKPDPKPAVKPAPKPAGHASKAKPENAGARKWWRQLTDSELGMYGLPVPPPGNHLGRIPNVVLQAFGELPKEMRAHFMAA